MLNKKIPKYIHSDAILLFLLSLTYAGLSSGVFFGIRVVDILLLAGILFKSKVKVDLTIWTLLILWFVSVGISTYVGFADHTPYLLSDLRFFISFGLGVFLGASMGKQTTVNLEHVFYALLVGSLLIYVIIPYLPTLRFYYIPKIFQSQEHENTIFGPSMVLINFLYAYLIFKNRDRPVWFYLVFIVFTLLIFAMRISRLNLVIMLGLVAWSIGYRLIYRIKLTHLLLGITACLAGLIYITQTQNERIKGIFNPSEDTSYNYRVLTNSAFLNQLAHADGTHKAFGFGMGAVFVFHYNEYLGMRVLNILDNTPITILLKSGYVGLALYVLILLYPLIYISWHKRLVLIFPFVLTMFLFFHALFIVLYIFGMFFIV